MNVSIITVGNEIVTGDIVDLNSPFLAKELNEMGHMVKSINSVGDDASLISKQVLLSLDSSDIVFVAGGIGPTADDVTVSSIASALGLELLYDKVMFERLKGIFERMNRTMTDNNIKQAYKIVGSEVIINENGTASGSKIVFGEKIIYILPGPPFELQNMFYSIKDQLKSDLVIKSIMFRCLGIGESALETKISDIISSDKIEYGIYANKQYVDIKITAKNIDEKEVEKILSEYEELILNRISEFVYSRDKSIVEVIIDNLKQKNKTIAIAESCSGGMLTSMFVDIAGSSQVLNEAVVTYSNESKNKRLGVSNEELDKYGAVSEEVAKSMAEGVCEALNSDLGVSITGIAGPGGGSSEKPVGLVYICVYYDGVHHAQKLELAGDRTRVRSLAVLNCLALIYDVIK